MEGSRKTACYKHVGSVYRKTLVVLFLINSAVSKASETYASLRDFQIAGTSLES